MTKKEELYLLLDLYKNGRYDVGDFCNELTMILYFEKSLLSELSGLEHEIFDYLGKIANRHSPFESDFINCPGVYYTDEEVKKAIEITFTRLEELGLYKSIRINGKTS